MLKSNLLSDGPDTGGFAFARDGAITIVVLLLVFAAFDDITTDNATAFPMEYSFLVVCAGWLAYVIARLLRSDHPILGGLSALALIAGVWAQRSIGPGIVAGWWPEYIVIVAVFVWFSGLSLTLLWLGLRTPQPPTDGEHV